MGKSKDEGNINTVGTAAQGLLKIANHSELYEMELWASIAVLHQIDEEITHISTAMNSPDYLEEFADLPCTAVGALVLEIMGLLLHPHKLHIGSAAEEIGKVFVKVIRDFKPEHAKLGKQQIEHQENRIIQEILDAEGKEREILEERVWGRSGVITDIVDRLDKRGC